ncbi:hypothetical protein ACRZCT_001908 [Aeromonas hydrophila]
MHPTRQKLLDTGLAIATDKGLRGLTVRELAAVASSAGCPNRPPPFSAR